MPQGLGNCRWLDGPKLPRPDWVIASDGLLLVTLYMDHFRHRASTGLKQENKSHKFARGQRRIKGAGRIEISNPRKQQDHSKEKRIQHSKQLRKDKRDGILKVKRGKCAGTTPRLVAVIPLSPNSDSTDIARRLAGNCKACDTGAVAIRGDILVICTGHGNLVASLKACARADVVVLLMQLALENGGDNEIIESMISSESTKLTGTAPATTLSEAS